MTEKLLLFGIGYVLGTRAGRQRYHELVDMAKTAWRRDEVQMAVSMISGLVEERLAGLGGSGESHLAA